MNTKAAKYGLLVIMLILCSLPGFAEENRGDAERANVLAHTDLYITVGSKGCEFATIREALGVVTEKRRVIYVMDPVHTECGITVTTTVAIRGFGSAETVVQGAEAKETAADRVFLVEEGGNLTLSGLTICHGFVNAVPRCGAGIYNLGTCFVEDCVVRDNTATYGVGIISSGPLTVLRTAILDNVSIPRPLAEEYAAIGCGGKGCGLRTEKGCVARVEECLISGNSARKSGGGVFVACESSLTMINTTVSGNSCLDNGGGISIRGDLVLIHCTVAANKAGKKCGGIFNEGMVDMTATLVAGNNGKQVIVGESGLGVYGSGTFRTNMWNLVSDGSLEGTAIGDPLVAPLADNGGKTKTHALLKGSPAIDAIPKGTKFTTVDQRGLPRPDASGLCDIGAYEAQ